MTREQFQEKYKLSLPLKTRKEFKAARRRMGIQRIGGTEDLERMRRRRRAKRNETERKVGMCRGDREISRRPCYGVIGMCLPALW